ncbi:TetR family transcriptional regulator [Rudanella paleaurantiibacter]|uniref:TetR family transcriptional regulator n=1 Tax=Rudanella paleaurantiibacter TaxID=2614655 RepID=A0A7J5TSW3_9BACT|nr:MULTISPECIES: TetR/AcrR family transcriptional regulator [Rudanella]KAB7726444.1 TetR family transcriptional regulator [Rudanella paleaurantiibacter]
MAKPDVKEPNLRTVILEQATKLFKLFGYNKLVMDDIARAVGKSRSTLYLYFKDKEEIFSTIAEGEIKLYLHELISDLPNHPTAADQLRAYFRIKFDFRHAKATEFLTMTREGYPELLAKMRLHTDPPEIAHLTGIIRFGVANGEFEPLTDMQIELMANMMVSALHGIANDLTAQPETSDVVSVHSLLQLLFVSGLEKRT